MLHVAALALLVRAGIAAESTWWTLPAARELHPTGDPIGLRWQRAMATTMAGPLASPIYREPAARFDALWRIAAATSRSPLFEEDDPQLALDLALAGAFAGADLAWREAAARDEGVETARRLAGGVFGPGVEVRRSPEATDVRLDDRPPAAREIAAAIDEPVLRRPGRGPPPRTLRVGTALRAASAGATAESGFRPGPAAYLIATRFGPDLAHAEAMLQEGEQGRAALSWSAAARESVHPRFALIGGLRGDQRSTRRAEAAVEWRPPLRSAWAIRLGRAWTSAAPAAPFTPRYDLQVRALLRWHLPADIDRWPLGLEPGARGPWLPFVEDRGPNEIPPVVRPAAWATLPEEAARAAPQG